MKKRDFETYQKRFRDFEILPKFSETHVFRGTIRHPYFSLESVITTDGIKIFSITFFALPSYCLLHLQNSERRCHDCALRYIFLHAALRCSSFRLKQ